MMNIFDYVISAVKNLKSNVIRTFLTIIGIVIGINSVIMINMLGNSLGSTLTEFFNALIKKQYAQIILVPDEGNDAKPDEYGYYDTGNVVLSDRILERYESRNEDAVERVRFCDKDYAAMISEGEKDNSVMVSGVSPSYDGLVGGDVIKGRFINDNDVANCVSAAVISELAAEKCFGDEDPIGRQISVVSTEDGGYSFSLTVVGVYKYSELINGFYLDGKESSLLYIPYSYMEHITNKRISDSGSVLYQVRDDGINADSKAFFIRDTEAFFEQYLNGTGWKASVEFIQDDINKYNSIIDVVTTIITFIAMISLFVGGIGVMNVMIVSVSERTTEIGVRKAMGASNLSIIMQFLVESVMIVLLGSAIAILLGMFFMKCIALLLVHFAGEYNIAMNVDLSMSPQIIFIAILFSLFIGIVFGISPALKAARMEIVDALRYE